jgi:aldose 1-epimerase
MTISTNYSVRRTMRAGCEVIHLVDTASRADVMIVPAFGNNAFEFNVDCHNLMWSEKTLGELLAKPDFVANFFMAPWANRLSPNTFHANGRKYLLNPDLKNFYRDEFGQAMHGVVAFSRDWEVISLEADGESARTTSRLEYWRYPALMAQFPFAHTIEMTHRLRAGVLEVETVLHNHAAEPMPVGIGYHPCFNLRGATRKTCRLRIGAKSELLVSEQNVATGESKPLAHSDEQLLAAPQQMFVFGDLVAGSRGGAEFSVESPEERITLVQGPKYGVSVFYAPHHVNLFCIEPMTTSINALNPLPDGSFLPVQTISPGGSWRESFWIRHERLS